MRRVVLAQAMLACGCALISGLSDVTVTQEGGTGDDAKRFAVHRYTHRADPEIRAVRPDLRVRVILAGQAAPEADVAVPAQALMNIASRHSPGQTGTIDIAWTMPNLQPVVEELKSGVTLLPDVKITGGEFNQATHVDIREKDIAVTNRLVFSAEGTRAGHVPCIRQDEDVRSAMHAPERFGFALLLFRVHVGHDPFLFVFTLCRNLPTLITARVTVPRPISWASSRAATRST